MSIEVAIIPEAIDEKRVLGTIHPGEPLSISDFSSGNRETISAVCNLDDSGGEVYIFENDGFAQTRQHRAIPAEYYTEENLDAQIAHRGSYERDVLTETRKKGRLILTHIPD